MASATAASSKRTLIAALPLSVVQMLATLAVLGGLQPLLLPLAGIPPLVIGLRIEKLWERVRQEHAEARRSMALLSELATTAPAGKEIRVFDLADELERRYRSTFETVDRRERSVDIRAGLMSAAGWGCFALGYMAALALVVSRAVAGDLSVGAVVVTLSLGAQVNRQVTELVDNARWFTRTTEAVGRYRWLADYSARAHAALVPTDPAPVPERLISGITFDGVGFTYPGTDAPVLEHLDLHLPAGSIVAIVGDNGAGKTTLAKLLLRSCASTSRRTAASSSMASTSGASTWPSGAGGCPQVSKTSPSCSSWPVNPWALAPCPT